MGLRILKLEDMVRKVSEIIGGLPEGESKMENKIIIAELVYPNPKLITDPSDFNIENYGNYYIPKIHTFMKSEDSIKKELIYNTIIDLNQEGESDNVTYKRIYYAISPESYNYASKTVNNENRTLEEDLETGRFFNRAIHEAISEQFFNSTDYLETIFNKGIIDRIKDGDLEKDCTHTFLVDPVILEGMLVAPEPQYTQEDLEEMRKLLGLIQDYRKSLKSFTFNLGKKNADGDITTCLVNSLGEMKESITNLKYAETMLANRFYNKADKVKEEKENIVDINTDRDGDLFKGFKNLNLKPNYSLRNARIKEQQEIVQKNFEKFNAKFNEITKITAKNMSKALNNMKKFAEENKEDK